MRRFQVVNEITAGFNLSLWCQLGSLRCIRGTKGKMWYSHLQRYLFLAPKLQVYSNSMDVFIQIRLPNNSPLHIGQPFEVWFTSQARWNCHVSSVGMAQNDLTKPLVSWSNSSKNMIIYRVLVPFKSFFFVSPGTWFWWVFGRPSGSMWPLKPCVCPRWCNMDSLALEFTTASTNGMRQGT